MLWRDVDKQELSWQGSWPMKSFRVVFWRIKKLRGHITLCVIETLILYGKGLKGYCTLWDNSLLHQLCGTVVGFDVYGNKSVSLLTRQRKEMCRNIIFLMMRPVAVWQWGSFILPRLIKVGSNDLFLRREKERCGLVGHQRKIIQDMIFCSDQVCKVLVR